MTLRQAWKFRMEQDFDRCREVVRTLRKKAGVTEETMLEEWEKSHSAYLGELCLLQASLFRADGNIPKSQQWVAQLERGRSPTFSLRFQKAANNYCLGKYGEALEEYLEAARAARSRRERVLALVNGVFCLENLGEPYETLLGEVTRILDKLSPRDLPALRSQLVLFGLRDHFRRGNFREVFDEPLGSTVDQRYHFRLWLSEIPYHEGFLRISAPAREKYLTQNRVLFRRSYRLRTIQGTWESEDLQWDQPLELADRLYLWTWRWMCFPERISLPAVFSTIEALRQSEGGARFAAEDHQMIRNALSWLRLLLPAERGRLAKPLQERKKNPPDFPIFDLERLILEYLAAPEEKKLREIRGHALWKSDQHELRGLLEFVRGDRNEPPVNLESFARRLKKFVGVETTEGFTVVDLRSLKILPFKKGEPRFSEPLARGLALLAQERDVPFQTLLSTSFGIHRYQAGIHKTKILNLISRLRPCLPAEARVETHADVAHAVGNWERVKVISGFAAEAASLPTVRETRASEVKLPMLVQLPKSSVFTRSDLERKFGTSRTATTRMLKEWLQKGWVSRYGNAKATSYRVV